MSTCSAEKALAVLAPTASAKGRWSSFWVRVRHLVTAFTSSPYRPITTKNPPYGGFHRQTRRSAADSTSLEARSAHVHALMRAVLDDTDALNVRAPPAIGLLLRPGDVVSETGALSADVTHSSHWEISCSGSSARRTRRNRWVRGFLQELDKTIR